MTKIVQGVVHGRIIELKEDPGLADGDEVTVVLQSPAPATSTGPRMPFWDGDLPDDPEDDRILDEIQRARKGARLREIPE